MPFDTMGLASGTEYDSGAWDRFVLPVVDPIGLPKGTEYESCAPVDANPCWLVTIEFWDTMGLASGTE